MVCFICLSNMATAIERRMDGNSPDLDEVQAKALLEQFDNVQQIQQWITVDKRPDRQEKWLNLLLRKLS